MAGDILVVGGTGQQGKATIDALLASPRYAKDTQIFALTRSSSSANAQALQNCYPDITLVEGDIASPQEVFKTHPSITSTFLVTTPPHDVEQALPFIDAAIQAKIRHIVFSSVDRGGEKQSWEESTAVPHFAAKYQVELHLRQACDQNDVQWTILRPTSFMDSYNPGTFGKMIVSLWAAGMSSDQEMQLISTHDIGHFAAEALLDPEKWHGRSTSLAGDSLSFKQLQETFSRVTDAPLPQLPTILGRAILWFNKDAYTSFDWFRTVGYGADIVSLRSEYPGLQTFEKWLMESSKWTRETKASG